MAVMASMAAAEDGGRIRIRWQDEIDNDEGGSGSQQQQSGMIIDINGGGAMRKKLLSSSSFTLFHLGKASKICKLSIGLSPATQGTTTLIPMRDFSNPTQKHKFPDQYAES